MGSPPPPDRSPSEPLLVLQQVSLGYGSLRALKNVDLSIHRSEMHALVGEHGAGKSSLCFVMSGQVRPTSGRLVVRGRSVASLTVKRACSLGIEMVNQNNPLFDNLPIADNLFVSGGTFPPRAFFDHSKRVELTHRFFDQHGFGFDPEAELRELDASDRHLIGILKHLCVRPKLIILDESLDKLRTESLYRILDILNQMRAEGTAVLLVTHRIDDIYQIADRVTILREGEIYVTDSVRNIDKINLIRLAYTQMNEPSKFEVTRKDFHQMLKYNEAILLGLPVNLIVVDAENRIKMINDRAKSYFGLGAADSYNLLLESLFTEENAEQLGLIHRALEKAEGESFFSVPFRIGEARRKHNLTVRPIYDGALRIGGMIIIDDVTEQEKLREQMVLSEKLASVGLLAAGVAHEINNPLETIHNFVEFLKYSVAESKAGEALAHIDEEVSSISQIVGNLISFSDDDRSSDETIDVNVLIERILSLVRHDAANRGIRITFRHHADSLRLMVSPNEIKQVVLNLLKNSFDALPGGGDITIATAPIQVQGEKRALIIFEDTGGGIRADNVYDVFLPFFSSKSQSHHMGLGLSISYSIIKKYHGEISVTNLPDRGCRFSITLPLGEGSF
jgi:two-component system sensor histidine kinase AtoS